MKEPRSTFQTQVMKTFGKRLRLARMKKYASATKFAGMLGTNEHAYRKYERGETSPNLETLTRICELLDVTPNHLLPVASKEKKAAKKSPSDSSPTTAVA